MKSKLLEGPVFRIQHFGGFRVREELVVRVGV